MELTKNERNCMRFLLREGKHKLEDEHYALSRHVERNDLHTNVGYTKQIQEVYMRLKTVEGLIEKFGPFEVGPSPTVGQNREGGHAVDIPDAR